MYKMMTLSGVLLAAGAALLLGEQGAAQRPDAQELSLVVVEIERLDALRSSLAGTFAGEPDRSTFAQVCKPVGAEAKRLAEEQGWRIAQLAEKNRNSANVLDEQAARIYRWMAEDADVMGVWLRDKLQGSSGTRYFRRIVVEPACLACHGPKDKRPEFVKQGYPEDRAYDFQVGDLRGLYSVFVVDQGT